MIFGFLTPREAKELRQQVAHYKMAFEDEKLAHNQTAIKLNLANQDKSGLSTRIVTLNKTIDELQKEIEKLTGQNAQLKGLADNQKVDGQKPKKQPQPRGNNGRFKPKWNK